MDMDDLQKTYGYNQVRVNKGNDLQWVVNVVVDICGIKLTDEECEYLLISLNDGEERVE